MKEEKKEGGNAKEQKKGEGNEKNWGGGQTRSIRTRREQEAGEEEGNTKQ